MKKHDTQTQENMIQFQEKRNKSKMELCLIYFKKAIAKSLLIVFSLRLTVKKLYKLGSENLKKPLSL